MDYVKQMEVLRQRNIDLNNENVRLMEELKSLKKQLETQDASEAESKKVFEDTKQKLIDALEQYKKINEELENYKIEYQIKLKELSDTLLATRDVVSLRDDDKYSKDVRKLETDR